MEQNNLENNWNLCLKEIKDFLDDKNIFDKFFKTAKLACFEDGVAIINVDYKLQQLFLAGEKILLKKIIEFIFNQKCEEIEIYVKIQENQYKRTRLDLDEIWNRCLKDIEEILDNKKVFNLFYIDTILNSFDNEKAVILVDSRLQLLRLNEDQEIIRIAIMNQTDEVCKEVKIIQIEKGKENENSKK